MIIDIKYDADIAISYFTRKYSTRLMFQFSTTLRSQYQIFQKRKVFKNIEK